MASEARSNIPVHDSKSDAPPLFDGTPRMYICLLCPFAHRTWIARNYKGLHNIELHAINLEDKPSWYLEKVYPAGLVPSLEHNGKVIGESLDILEYLENNFEGPSIYSKDLKIKESEDELLKYFGTFHKLTFSALKMTNPKKSSIDETAGIAFDYLENALGKHRDEGPFLVGHLGVVDFAYITFVYRFNVVFESNLSYNILHGRTKLAKWLEEMDKVEAYDKTKPSREDAIELYRRVLART